MSSLARRNLFHDKVRLTVTLTGITFALVLIAVQTGLFIGFTTTTSHVIDHSAADLWIASKGLLNFDSGYPFPERRLHQVLATPGILTADQYIVQQTNWKKPDGGQETVEVVGFNPETGLGGPWNVVAGRIEDLKAADTAFIDELFRQKLGVVRLGQTLEINSFRVRVVGFTRGIRSFTTAPFVFTSFKNARRYTGVAESKTIYVVARVKPGADIAGVKRLLSSRLRGVDVFTARELSHQTRFYWMLTTGAGMTLLIAALMGLIVGVVVVAQTIYATTVDHLADFGTLKAMGASNARVYWVVVQQALYSAVIGYALGLAVSLIVVYVSRDATVAILLPWPAAVGLFALALVMCVGASVVSVRKVAHIDPAMVFKS